ncbi:SDR family oxidoreductase [uncultured Cocleimonas sp.]|uniref:SDR family oxidoreductase n=1 Tax=uncultured Cocleimonas sp. TaxID=1051587 RepID=UPI002617351B|nr:SDR family oxidoreductase [uncultured Cocleimonas sp.]
MTSENASHSPNIHLKNCWIVGCGDIGKRVAALLASEDQLETQSIKAIVSSTESVEQCQTLNIDAHAVDLDSSYSLDGFDFEEAAVYYFAPPTPRGCEDQRLKQFLQQLGSAKPRRIVLISTTGVYGDSAGEWIDENSAVNPKAERAIRRLSAEQILQVWSDKTDSEFMILRVPGIYAKERLPLERLKKGLPVINADDAGYTNRIHADDLAQACVAAMECKLSNEIINVTDGNPSTMTDYFNNVADFAGLPRPPQISLEAAEKTLSAGMISYMKESRRIKNDKMLESLKIKMRYPDLKTTLQR